jgi:hypothetical protein
MNDAATDSPRAARQEKIAPSVASTRSSHSQSSSSNKANGSGSGAEDIEMGAHSKAHDKLDDALEKQSLLEMEEQSLLKKEIRARRLQRAPTAKHQLASSATPSQTSASTSTSALIRNSQTVAREIKRKAEAMMSKMTHTNDRDKAKGGEASIFSSLSKRGRRLRMAKFAIIAFGFTVIFFIVVLILLLIFGGDEWNIAGTTNVDATQVPNQAGSVSVDTSGPSLIATAPILDVKNHIPKFSYDVSDAV